MFLTGFTNHLLITFHLRRCQYHIKVINDLRQFCITVGFRVYIIPLGFSCFSCPRSRRRGTRARQARMTAEMAKTGP